MLRQKSGQRLWRGQRVTAIGAVHLTRQRGIDGREMRTGNVSLRIHPRASARIRQIVSAVKNDPGRIREMAREFFRADQHRLTLTWNGF